MKKEPTVMLAGRVTREVWEVICDAAEKQNMKLGTLTARILTRAANSRTRILARRKKQK